MEKFAALPLYNWGENGNKCPVQKLFTNVYLAILFPGLMTAVLLAVGNEPTCSLKPALSSSSVLSKAADLHNTAVPNEHQIWAIKTWESSMWNKGSIFIHNFMK